MKFVEFTHYKTVAPVLINLDLVTHVVKFQKGCRLWTSRLEGTSSYVDINESFEEVKSKIFPKSFNIGPG